MLSAYERERLENIKEKNKILSELGLKTDQLEMAAVSNVPLKRKSIAGAKRVVKEKPQQQPPTRRSKRTRGEAVEAYISDDIQPVVEVDRSTQQNNPRIEGEISFNADTKEFFEDKKQDIITIETNPEYQNLSIPIPSGSCKVTDGMVFSIAVHPSPIKLISAIGDKYGTLAFWDLNDTLSQSQTSFIDFPPLVHSLKAHTKPISKIIYHPGDTNKIFTSSYDGSIRMMDIVNGKSVEVFVEDDEALITHFDMENNNIWFSTSDGYVGLQDTREQKSSSAQLYRFSEKKINTIHLNPIDHNVIVTCGLDRVIRLHDKRNLKNPSEELIKPIFDLSHPLSVNSVYWDSTGKDLLSTSFDDTIGLWKNVMETKEQGLISIRHNNHTGRWVQKFKAVWRNGHSTFSIGNMARSIDVYDGERGNQIAALQNSRLTAIPSVISWHPSLNLIVSGNASGRCNIWK